MNFFKNIGNKIVGWGRKFGVFVKETASPKIKTWGHKSFAFIRWHWKPFAIGGLVFFHIALFVTIGAILPWYVILAFLPFMVVLGVVIGFRKKVARWITICWRGIGKIKFVEPGTEEPKLTKWGVFASKIVIPLLTAFSTIAIVAAVFWEFNSQKKSIENQAEYLK